MPPFVRLFLPFHCRQKRAKWKLFFVKAPLKTHTCEFVRHKVCNPHCRGPPPQCCLCVNWSIYGQLSILVHPSLPPFFCCLTLFCPPTLPPARIAGGFFFFPGVQCFSRRFDCQQPKMEGSEPMLYLPRSLITQTWFVIYTLIGTALTHLGCTGGSGLGGRVKSEVASSRLGPQRRFIVNKETLQAAAAAEASDDESCLLFSSGNLLFFSGLEAQLSL